MAGKSNIEWTGHTWNPIAGCSVKSPGCKHCYAMPLAARLAAMGQELYKGLTDKSKAGPVFNGTVRRASEDVLLAPLRRKKPTTYFVNSMSDLFHENVPDEWIDRIFAVMALCPQHTFQCLTKRSDRMREYMNCEDRQYRIELAMCEIGGDHDARTIQDEQWPLANVWLGVSTERQQEANERIPDLLQTPAAVRFISAEPLIGPLDLTAIDTGMHDGTHVIINALTGLATAGDDVITGLYAQPDRNLNWVIVGGESGHGARPMHPTWALSIRDQMASNDMLDRLFFKQWGSYKPVGWVHANSRGALVRPDGHICRTRDELAPSGNFEMEMVGKAKAGRLLDGREHNGMPG